MTVISLVRSVFGDNEICHGLVNLPIRVDHPI